MLQFLINNIYDAFGDHAFQQSVELSMGTNLLDELFLYSYEAECIQKLHIQYVVHEKQKYIVVFNLTLRDIDDVLSIKKTSFHSFTAFGIFLWTENKRHPSLP